MLKYISVLLIFVVLTAPVQHVNAEASVGIGTAKIAPVQTLISGSVTILEPVVVHNDGDLPGIYVMSVMFNEKQDEHKPGVEWFSFSDQQFDLQPGESKAVVLILTIPEDATRGDYFAYIEAGCKEVNVDNSKSTSIKASSAAKLNFSVKHAEVPIVEATTQTITNAKPNVVTTLQLERKQEKTAIPGLILDKAFTISSIL